MALLGARQVGKTTLAEQIAAEWRGPVTFFDLETAAARESLSTTPEASLKECEGLVVIDEVHGWYGMKAPPTGIEPFV